MKNGRQIKIRYFALIFLLLGILTGCGAQRAGAAPNQSAEQAGNGDVNHKDITASTEFEQCVLDGRYSDAIDEYNDTIAGNAGDESKAVSFVDEFLKQRLEDYGAGALSNEDMEIALTTVEKINSSLQFATMELEAAWAEYHEISTAKTSYMNAIAAMENEDYLNAIQELFNVTEADTEHYADALTKTDECRSLYVSQQVAIATAYIQNSEYEQAINTVDTAEGQMGMQDELENVRNDAETSWKAAVIQQAENTAENGDYEAALELLSSVPDYLYDGEEITACRSELYAAWKASILQQANDAAANEDYSTSLSVIEDGLGIFENDSELLALKETISEQYDDYLRRTTPVSLAELEPYQQGGELRYSTDSVEDIFGNTYRTYITTGLFGSDGNGDTWCIDGIYQTFSGTIFIPSTKTSVEDYVTIYGDGVKLLDVTVHGGEDPTPFNLDVTGVQDLTVVLNGGWWGLYIGEPILTP